MMDVASSLVTPAGSPATRNVVPLPGIRVAMGVQSNVDGKKMLGVLDDMASGIHKERIIDIEKKDEVYA